MELSGITVYPVKSCRGAAVESAEVVASGLDGDRGWMVVDLDGRFLSQREAPRLALVTPGLHPGILRIEGPGMEPLEIPREPDGAGDSRRAGGIGGAAPRPVQVWDDPCEGWDEGDTAAAWFTGYLGRDCRLVRRGSGVDARRDGLSFVDDQPFLLISEGSLGGLNERLTAAGEAPLPMNRFRPNLVVRDCLPHAEDEWPGVRIGALEFARVKPCSRCTITTIDQATTQAGREPLRTLAQYRRTEQGKVTFGVYLRHAAGGRLFVGDAVEPLRARWASQARSGRQ